MNEHILLVEDNRALAENVAEMLRDEGAEVTLCSDAESATQHATQRGFDLAIVDIGLGGRESGLDLLPRLRRESAHGEILLITGNASVQSAIQAIRSGVYAYVPKPFEPEQFSTLVRRALAQVALKRDKLALSQRLLASEALHRSVVETVEACILGLSASGEICFANRFTADCLGLAQGDLVGRALTRLGEAPLGANLDAAIERAAQGASVRDVECKHIMTSGTRVIRWTLTPLLSAGADELLRGIEPTRTNTPTVLAVGIDTTERLALERKNAEAEAMAAMGTLTTSLAHEIRNPLNAAKLQLELLLRRAKRAGESELQRALTEPAALVRAELLRLSELLDDFLNLARPRQVVRAQVRVRELFENVVTLKAPLAQSARAVLTYEDVSEALTVRADPDKLKQVLINLIGNAIEALSEAQRTDGKITLSAGQTERGTVLSVTDNGPGIPSELRASAFEPFVTSKPGGTGLGLAIVHKIAAQHGGEAELVAREGGGTVARILIPNRGA